MTTIVKGKTVELHAECAHCEGSGSRLITGVYLRTYQLVEANPRLNGAQLANLANCKPTAMNNRLAALERMDLIGYDQDGRQKLWWVAE